MTQGSILHLPPKIERIPTHVPSQLDTILQFCDGFLLAFQRFVGFCTSFQWRSGRSAEGEEDRSRPIDPLIKSQKSKVIQKLFNYSNKMRTEEVLSSTCAKSNDVNAGGRKTIEEDVAVIVDIKSDDVLFSEEAESVPSLDSESEEESDEEWESDDEEMDDDEGEPMHFNVVRVSMDGMGLTSKFCLFFCMNLFVSMAFMPKLSPLLSEIQTPSLTKA